MGVEARVNAQHRQIQMQNVISLALAIEALETLLIAKGILKDNDVLDKIKALMDEKVAQVSAQKAAEPENSRIIIPV